MYSIDVEVTEITHHKYDEWVTSAEHDIYQLLSWTVFILYIMNQLQWKENNADSEPDSEGTNDVFSISFSLPLSGFLSNCMLITYM